MTRPSLHDGRKNLISNKLIELRRKRSLSQRALAGKLQLIGMDMDKNVITRIETNKRYVSDMELRALATVLQVTYNDLLDPPEMLSAEDPSHA